MIPNKAPQVIDAFGDCLAFFTSTPTGERQDGKIDGLFQYNTQKGLFAAFFNLEGGKSKP